MLTFGHIERQPALTRWRINGMLADYLVAARYEKLLSSRDSLLFSGQLSERSLELNPLLSRH